MVWNRKHLDILIGAVLLTVCGISFSSVTSCVGIKQQHRKQREDMLHINLL